MSERTFLDRRAAESGITVDDAIAAVTEVTGAAPRAVEQFGGGWGAVPFRATAPDGEPLIVRIAYRSDRPYVHEQRVMDFVRERGIPAPRVLGVTRVREHPVSVLASLPGVPWNDIVRMRSIEEPELAEVARSIGRLLRKIHDTDIVGLALPLGDAEPRDLAVLDPYLDATQRRIIEVAVSMCIPMPEPPTRVLVHEDFGGDHVLVDGTAIAGVIDWEHTSLGDPARDLGWWRAYDDLNGGSYELVRDGYGPVDDPFLDDRVRRWTMFEHINGMAFAASKGFTDGLADACDKLALELNPDRHPHLDR